MLFPWSAFAGRLLVTNSSKFLKKVATVYHNKMKLLFQGSSGFCFAFLHYLKSTGIFIGFSYLLRFLEGLGTAMAWSSALGILMKVFPNKVAKVMSWTQTCFGLGFMLGKQFVIYNLIL